MLGSWPTGTLPNLTDDICIVKSPFDPNYNCIAFAAGDPSNWWWPADGDYWPDNIPRELTVDAFIRAYGTRGYVQCDDGWIEYGFEKVALYGKAQFQGGPLSPTHAAKQLPDGRWASKLGNYEDVEHATTEAVNCSAYGAVLCYLKRSKGGIVKEPSKNNDTKKSEVTTDMARGTADKSPVPSGVENPKHREDFTSLVNEAARKRPQGD